MIFFSLIFVFICLLGKVMAAVKLQHSWSQIFTGETITLRCEIQGGEGKVWKYEWTAPNTNSPPTSSEYRISRVSVSHSGDYRCRGSSDYLLTGWSDAFRLTVSFPSKPTVTLQPSWTQIYSGETVTVRCEIQGGEGAQWTYEWRAAKLNTPPTSNEYRIIRATESDSGGYSCRGRRDYFFSEWSDIITLTVSYKPKAKLRADNTAVPVGGSVTLTCSVNPSSSSGWKYYWYRDEKSSEALTTQDAVFHSNGQISVSQEGLYRCRGGRGNPVYYTEDSQSVRIGKTVTASNRPVVTLYPNWSEIYRGETITVRCEIHGGDTEWDYEWETNSMIKAPNQNEYRIISASSSNSGNYRCKGRMKSSQHETTEWSDSVTLTVSDNVHSAASLTVSPDRVQHFTSDSVSLTCEGNFTEWRVRKFSEDGRLYSDCRRMTGSTCNIHTSKSDTAVYWCESGSGEFSSAVNITVQNDGNGPILVSPVHPVTEGASVSLSCSLRTQKILSNVFFYHNDKLIENDPRGELKISAVSKSDEGFYKCQYSGRESAQSWMSVKVTVSGADSSSSPVWLTVRLVCGVSLIIILLLLLYRCTTTNSETFSFT
uniref:Ig-like domain-containing protein n=1 Tax=Astatotilapia calliptera TaxID=8154 RepID=A0A3P8RJD8_ASTCA